MSTRYHKKQKETKIEETLNSFFVNYFFGGIHKIYKL